MRRYLGIDPGTTGAFAVLDVHDDGRQELAIIATPTLWMAKGRNGRRRRYDIQTLWARLLACTLASPFTGQEAPMIFAYLEEQSARPQQGVVSMFQTGFGIGMWTALLVAEGMRRRRGALKRSSCVSTAEASHAYDLAAGVRWPVRSDDR